MKDSFKNCLRLSGNDLVEAFILMDRYYLTLPDNYLTKVDRASMAYALEVRSPFLDYRFFEYASKIPSEWKASPLRTKIFMRKLLKGIVPKQILNRKKRGFTPPLQEWILGKEYSEKLVRMLDELFNKKIIDKEWKEFYLKRVFPREDLISKNYRIRLFLFYRWAKYWRLL